MPPYSSFQQRYHKIHSHYKHLALLRILSTQYEVIIKLTYGILLSFLMEVQSNSVITNSQGPTENVRYNRETL